MIQNDGPVQMQTLFDTQRNAHRHAPFPEWDVRLDRLQRLRRMIEDNESAIEAAIDADFGGRPAIETQIAEVFPSLSEIRTVSRRGKAWMKERGVWVSKWFLPARAHIMPRPLGVIGIIVPWNYPLGMAVGPLAGALAAGNRAMVKMSEYTPGFSALFQRLVADAFRPDEVAVVTGGADVAAAFSSLPFDHLVFTGSTAVGRKVMSAASANLTPVTLELGGKSPSVIAPGFPLDKAAGRILAGKLLNAGQTCVAPDYVLVPRGDVDAFVEAARAKARKMYPAGIADRDYCSIVDQRQYRRLLGYLDEARQAGVRVTELFEGAPRDDSAHRLGPVILVDPPPTLAAMRNEIFGPILPVLPYDRPEDAVEFINGLEHPLAMYWFDNDGSRAQWALRQTHVGGACINETLVHFAQEELPFGGVGSSGMGHYHGKWGFDSFSKLTPVFRQSRFNGMELMTAPYRPVVRRMLALMKRM